MKYHFEYSIGRISQLISKGIGNEFQKAFKASGINYSADEWTVIAYLYNYQSQTQKELSVATGKNKVAVTRLLQKLEEEGLVERISSVKDKRSNLLSLTVKGEDLYDSMLKVVEDCLDVLFNGLDEKYLDDLSQKMLELHKKISS